MRSRSRPAVARALTIAGTLMSTHGRAHSRPPGWRGEVWSVAAAAVGVGPDEGVALAVLVVDEVGVDRGGEARIVGPGGADHDTADEDPMAGGVLAGLLRLGDDADVLGLYREGDDFADEFVAGLLEDVDRGSPRGCSGRCRDCTWAAPRQSAAISSIKQPVRQPHSAPRTRATIRGQ